MYLGTSILIIYLPIALTFFMVGETFVGLVSVALAVAGAGIMIIYELKRGRGDVNGMLNFLRNSTFSTVDEKIAVLYGYANNVPTWKKNKINIDFMTKQINFDIASSARVRNNMGWEQWEGSNQSFGDFD